MYKIGKMKYAVIRINGNQYKVAEGDEIAVSHLSDESPEIDVLLLANEGKGNVGEPLVNDVKVAFRVIEKDFKGEKITVLKYKAKSRYRKRRGFRPLFSKVVIEKIS